MKLTVLQVLPALQAGGVERGTLEVAAALIKRGHRSLVLSAGGALAEELEAGGSQHITMPIGKKSPFVLRHVPALRKILRQQQVNILHARSRLPAWISFFAWRGMHQRPHFITGVHGCYSVNRYSRIMTSGERVIAISTFIHDYILENYPGVDPDKIVTIPRGVDKLVYPYGYRPTEGWLRDWQNNMPQTKGKYVIALPARISRRKGQEDFIEIIAALKAAGHNVHGLIIGGAENRRRPFFEELKHAVSDRGLASSISFAGHRNDLRDIMAASDLVLSLSRIPEAFGRTALEALSLGVPVIAYNHGGASEVMQSIFPEGLIKPGDTEQACQTIQSFMRNRPFVPDRNPFTLDSMLNNTIALYEQLAAAPEKS